MEKRLKMTRNIDIFLIIIGMIYLLFVAFTEITLSPRILLFIILLNALIRGLETKWRGRKVASGMMFSFCLITLILIIISFAS